MKTREIDYLDGATNLKGFVAAPETMDKRPGILIAPTWAGRDEFVIEKAKALAEMGYVGFAIDMFGDAKLGSTNEECSQLITPLVNDRAILKGRVNLALTELKKLDEVDQARTAAMGFCFGGMCVLDLARSGADTLGVVSFHGLLQKPDSPSNIKAKVLALHGYDDPMADPDTLIKFTTELKEANCDWQVHAYGNTMHAFTNPKANDPSFGTVYQSTADKRSWNALTGFLKEIFSN